MNNNIDEIIKLLNQKYNCAKLITDITKKITISIKQINEKDLNDLLNKRFDVMKKVDYIDKSIQSKINGLPANVKYSVINTLNKNEVDANSKIAVLNRSIKQEMKRAYTIDKENQKLLMRFKK